MSKNRSLENMKMRNLKKKAENQFEEAPEESQEEEDIVMNRKDTSLGTDRKNLFTRKISNKKNIDNHVHTMILKMIDLDHSSKLAI